jgi:alcohol oxidase
MWGYKFSREIARRMPHFRGEPRALHPEFGAGRSSSLIEHSEGPVAFDAPRIVYEDDDERTLEAYVRKMGAWNLSLFCPKKQSLTTIPIAQ